MSTHHQTEIKNETKMVTSTVDIKLRSTVGIKLMSHIDIYLNIRIDINLMLQKPNVCTQHKYEDLIFMDFITNNINVFSALVELT